MITALLMSACATVVLDQATKALVTTRLTEARFYALVGSSGLRRRMNRRPGLVPLSGRAAAIVWLTSVAVLAQLVTIVPPLNFWGAMALGLVFGGAASNLCDRVTRGAVVDFIAVGRWPTFNVADAAMVAGTAATACSLV
jgi:signal peptidase II